MSMDPRTRALLEAPIASTLLRLATACATSTSIFGAAGGAWFGPLTWPWNTAAVLERRSPI
jgi:hypothetical protein